MTPDDIDSCTLVDKFLKGTTTPTLIYWKGEAGASISMTNITDPALLKEMIIDEEES